MSHLNGRRTALALAVLAALAWASRHAGCGRTPPAPAAPVALAAPAPPVAIPVKEKPSPRKPAVKIAEKPAETRGAGLREPGEAFGGRAPDRVDRSTPASR